MKFLAWPDAPSLRQLGVYDIGRAITLLFDFSHDHIKGS